MGSRVDKKCGLQLGLKKICSSRVRIERLWKKM